MSTTERWPICGKRRPRPGPHGTEEWVCVRIDAHGPRHHYVAQDRLGEDWVGREPGWSLRRGAAVDADPQDP